jgi:adenylate cyclase
MNVSDVRLAIDWLMSGCPSAPTPQQVLAELCDRLVCCGIPLSCADVFVRTLHPNVMGRRFSWRLESDVEISEISFDGLRSPEFEKSPVAQVCERGVACRLRFEDPDRSINSSIIHTLHNEQLTDFLATPLVFSNGEIHVATWGTQQTGGFADDEISGLESIIAPLTRVAEVYALRRTAANLLDTYVGHDSGERILAGQIRRGHTETVHAAIWLSDMRGFTALADRLPPQTLIDLLNRYFDCQVPAITRRGGEVLKFMGDGLLAVFPIAGSDGIARVVCNNALAAAYEVRTKVAKITESKDFVNLETVRFGVALHVGDVLYGNIGGGNRLDFTCIGPAVNLTSRLERLTGRLNRSILVSAEFARYCDAELIPAGEFVLAGFVKPEMAFGVQDEAG